MSIAPNRRRLSLKEYLTWEEGSGGKHEFYRGEVFAMAGATIRHNRIAKNILVSLDQLLEGKPCEPFGSDQRIRISAVDLSTYPEVSAVCGGPKTDPIDTHGITNPRVLFEVLSESTAKYDLGRKFEFYQQLDSFLEYVVVYQTEAKVIHYRRHDDGTWAYRLLAGMEATLDLESIGCGLSLASIYRNVEFGPEDEQPAAALPHPA